jgi:hypothetical protein
MPDFGGGGANSGDASTNAAGEVAEATAATDTTTEGTPAVAAETEAPTGE